MPIKTQKNVKKTMKPATLKVKATDLERIKKLIEEPVPIQNTVKRGFEYTKNEELEAKKQHLLEVRKEKEERLFQRFAEEEKKRDQLERGEDAVLALHRQEAIAKADNQMFIERDHVKAFVSKIKHCEMLEGLKIQQELKEYRLKLEKEMEDDYASLEAELLAKQEQDALERTEKAKKLKIEQKVVLEQQRDEIKIREDELKQKRIEEEEREKMIIMTGLYEEQFKKIQTDERKRLNGKELIEANEKLLEIRKQEQLKEAEDEKRIAEYNAKQEAKLNQRKKIENEKFETKQAMRMRLIRERAVELEKKEKLKQQQLDEKIRKHEKVVEQKINDDTEKRMQEQEKVKHIIRQQLEAKRKQIQQLKETEDKLEKDMMVYMDRKHNETQEKENFKRQKLNNRLEDMVKYNHDHHAMRIQAEEKARLDRITYGKSLLEKIKKEDAEYNTFAERCISEWQDNGRSVMPIVLELKRRKNEFMA